MKMLRKLTVIALIFVGTTTLRAADLILNEYNAVRASRWLDCDGMNCCCAQPICNGGDAPGTSCIKDDDCLGHFECSADGGQTLTGIVCDPGNGGAECMLLDPTWTCEEHTSDGVCLCDPPCKEDVFFGRVEGNGGNWFELVVTQEHLDIRGWRLEWTEEPSDAGSLLLTDDTVWSDLRAGTIITFTELDTAGGGLDSDTSYAPSIGDWWININTLSSDAVPQTMYVTTVTNVSGDGPGNFSVGNDKWQLTVLDAESTVVFGPSGEGVPLSDPGVSSREVFKLEEDPSPAVDPAASNYRDGTSSSFGHPNVWGGGDEHQDFICVRCNDGNFCNGAESCDADGFCQNGVYPCVDQAHCDEVSDKCLECLGSAECNDGNPCTENVCVDGACAFPTIPACAEGDDDPPVDTDLDGVLDILDECPNTEDQAPVDEHGCACIQLDSDSDGVNNCTDDCPGTPALAAVNMLGCGCSQSDDDHDGVDNCTDQCPATLPSDAADELGCACSQLDEDEDGLDDCADDCPGTTSGEMVDSKGCSCLQLDPDGDADGDGVLNCFDDCQDTIPGDAVDDRGCSCPQLDPDGDGDGDGVSDCLDECMDTPSNSEVGDDGCTIDFAEDTPSTEELPTGDSEISNVDPIAPSDENNLEDSTVSANRRSPCGFIGLMSLTFLLVGLMALRSCGGRSRRAHT